MVFILSKIIWMFLAPGNLLVLLLLLGAFLALARQESWQNAGRRICFDIAFVLFFIAIFPVGQWMLRPLEDRFPAVNMEQVDGVIVIGGDEDPELTEARNQPAVVTSADYYLVFATLAKQYPTAKLVYAGGSSRFMPSGKLTDADVAKQALASYGVPVDKMVFEDKSRTTRENAVNAADIVHPKPEEKWLLVTSAYHMPRSIATFRKAGWNVYPAPADFRTTGKLSSELHFDFSGHLGEMTMAAHEYYGLLAYWLLGYVDQPWPK